MSQTAKTTKSSRVSNRLHNALPLADLRLAGIEYRPPEALNAYARSLRQHPEKQMVKLCAAIAEFGFVVPVLVDEAGTVVSGHARVEAAKRLGLGEIPVISIAHLSPLQIKKLRLAENRLAELSKWDVEALTLELQEILTLDEGPIEVMGWEMGEIDALLTIDGGDQRGNVDPADFIPDVAAVSVSRLGDIWLLGKHRLICGSSLDATVWDVLMAGQIATMSFSDPPYNVKIGGNVSGLGRVRHAEFAMASGEMSEAEFTAFPANYLSLVTVHLVDGAIVDVCMDWRHLDQLLAAAKSVGLSLINMCCWAKSNASLGSLYRSKHELVLIFKHGNAPHINNVELGRYGRYRTNVWEYAGANSFGPSRDADLADHPTVKPVALVADAIRDVTKKGQIVLDAFIGSGTTILAAERTGRIAYGVEIEPKYVDVAIRRWEKVTSKTAVLAATGETFAECKARRAAGPLDGGAAG